jgi:pSer/pThr/pTyr-binding forkhead associated (FHA) protein
MFDFFKQKKEEAPNDVKGIREAILQFLKESLRKVEGGEGANIKGLRLFLNPSEEERHLYESAVYFDEPDRFRNEEVQRLADDYAIDLPQNWTMEMEFVDAIPAETIRYKQVQAGLFIMTRKQTTTTKIAKGFIHVISGETEKEVYELTSTGGKITIGRDKKVQTNDGFFRINTIAFNAESANASNRSVSRQHAHIEWSNENEAFLLFADEGGVPPRNKIKVRSSNNEPVKLQTTAVGHLLQEGDQIILGESALLQFSYSGEEK